MEDVLKYLGSKTFIGSAAIIIAMFVLLYIIKQYLIKKVAYTGKDEQHKNTFVGILFSVLQYIVIVVAIVVVMRLHGVNILSIVTGLGIMATIIGLALQDTLKDIIAGINIYNSNFYKVGDMVKYNGEECDVKYFSARVTKFQSIMTNSTYTVCNSSITSIEKIKDTRFVSLEFQFYADAKKITEAFDNTVKRLEGTGYIKEIINLGLCEYGGQGPVYGILYKCPAHKNLMQRMEILKVLHEEVNKMGLKPVFNGDVDVSIEKYLTKE